MICIVCKNQEAVDFKNIKQKRYWKCNYCEAIFLDKEFYLSSDDEHKHYLTHNNDVNDERYKKFLSNLMLPLIDRIKLKSIGLDYGCGPGPALSIMLREKGYQMFNYDPFFHPKKSNLSKKNYIYWQNKYIAEQHIKNFCNSAKSKAKNYAIKFTCCTWKNCQRKLA